MPSATQLFSTVLVLLAVLLIFNLMIIVHELGHFLAARWRGLVVEKFGIWFGKPLWQKKINGVVYSLGSIPAGGFVALPQLAPMEVMEGKVETPREQLPPISALDKIIVAIAGPLFSMLLAFIFAVIVWQVGRPVSEAEGSKIVGFVERGSPAGEAGIKVGDTILEVDGQPVSRFGGMGADSIQWRIVRSEGDTIAMKLQRGGEVIMAYPKPAIPSTQWWNRKGLRQIGIVPAATPMVAQVQPGSAAHQSGLKAGDLLTAVNGEKLYDELGIFQFAREHPDQPITLTVRRGGQTLEVPFTPGGAKVSLVAKGSPAEDSGVRIGDIVTGIDGKKLAVAGALTEAIQSRGTQAMVLNIDRGGLKRDLTVTPQIPEGDKTARIGVGWEDTGIAFDNMGLYTTIHPTPFEQVRSGVMAIFRTVDAVISRKSSISVQHMGGPVMMMHAYYRMLTSPEGIRMALWFSVVLNVNLALLNMLPIPVLDGGHITLAVIEAIRRRPVNVRILEYVQSACALVIIGFMLFIAFFDLQDLPWVGGGPKVEFKKAPAGEVQK